jgi:hypothetical protein
MNSTSWNGSPATAGLYPPFANASLSASRKPKSSQSRNVHAAPFDAGRVVSLPLYRAQRRRATIAAQKHARRRAVVALVLAIAGIIGSIATVEREVRLQQVERW